MTLSGWYQTQKSDIARTTASAVVSGYVNRMCQNGVSMSGSKQWQPQPCKCGSGRPAMPQTYNGAIVGFACVICQNFRLAFFRPELLNDPNFFFEPTPPKQNLD